MGAPPFVCTKQDEPAPASGSVELSGGVPWQSLDRMVRRRREWALRVARRRLGDEQDVADVVQEACLRAHQNLGALRDLALLDAWFAQILVNVCRDWLRARMRGEGLVAVRGPDAPGTSGATAHDSAVPDPFECLCRRRLGDRLQASIGALPSYHRRVILLREVDGLSYAEIAQAMRTSEGTVMSRLFHARHKLQRALQPLRPS